ncbi:glycosyl hydrolase family 18 protein [Clostridium paraputrificum]|uniref:glycosyl hydrolase family 18 protein n=1 Tax=Clostridium paraputrificum TaxID=29363 RepID=UPI00189F68F2|nr:glycosyl hydrolase family 18 protein [Clostridium paraputrificum]MDB2092370.1 glycosyl hydrolase family 18 protein [Clostridium paraputrificum]
MKKRLSLLLSLFLVVGSVGLTSGTVTTSAKENTDQAVVASTTSAATNKRVITYFPSWGMYEAGQQNITVDDIPWDKVSQVNHAFFEITNDFKIQTTDSYADFECADFKHSPEWGEGLAGHFGEYQYYKSKYPDVKIVIAVGGWTRSDKFHAAASTEQNRKTLAQSMVDTMKKYPFIDGIDIDWEYPTETRAPEDQYDRGSVGGPEDKHNFTLLLKTIRETFDQNGMKDKLLTVAVSAGESKIHNTEPDQYAQYVDAIGVMTYDFAGDWDDVTGHLAGLYHNPEDTTRPKFDTDDAMKIYSEEYNVPKSKLYAGSPLYSRGWGNVAPGPNGDGLFQPGNKNFTGNLGTGGQYSWYDIKNIEKTAGWVKYRDPIAKVPYLYNSSTKQFLTYEDETSLQDRINYINDNGYGGLIVWDCSGDDVKSGWPMHTIMFNGLIKDGSETPPTQNTLKAASLTAGPVSNGSFTLNVQIPANNTATSYQILEGNAVISTGSLTVGSALRNISYNVTGKGEGNYNYSVVLSDGSKTVTSNIVSVSVEKPSTYPAWDAWVSYKTGDIVSYNGKNYTCRQGHTSLAGWEPSNVPALWSLI